jgi:hypothetical protein
MRSIAAGALLTICLPLVLASETRAEGWLGADRGKLLLTSGFSTLDGAGGGALAPMALITGYGTSNSWGANVHVSGLAFDDLTVQSMGVGIGILDRFEISAARLSARFTDTVLEDLEADVDVVGVKVRVIGDAVYGQGSPLPQIALGAQLKRHRGFDNSPAPFDALATPRQVGALKDEDVEFFIAATKLSFERSVLINVDVRYSRANQFGLLGFGGDREPDRTFGVEATLGILLSRTLVVGAEYRMRPENLSVDREEDAWDAFLAWAPSRAVSFVVGYANIGTLLTPVTSSDARQDGAYISVQAGF